MWHSIGEKMRQASGRSAAPTHWQMKPGICSDSASAVISCFRLSALRPVVAYRRLRREQYVRRPVLLCTLHLC